MECAVDRLKRRHEFLRVAAASQNMPTKSLVLQACSNGIIPKKVRVGYTASRKVGNAVKRNRARRRLRAAVEKVIPLHAVEGYDYVLIARATTTERPFASLKQDLEFALKRLNVWRE